MALAGVGGRVLVRVPADADNRLLRIEVGSRSLVAVGEVALDGLASQDAYWFNLPALPAGYYFIKATVYGSNGPLSRGEPDHGVDKEIREMTTFDRRRVESAARRRQRVSPVRRRLRP
jgi:hypothetical protein